MTTLYGTGVRAKAAQAAEGKGIKRLKTRAPHPLGLGAGLLAGSGLQSLLPLSPSVRVAAASDPPTLQPSHSPAPSCVASCSLYLCQSVSTTSASVCLNLLAKVASASLFFFFFSPATCLSFLPSYCSRARHLDSLPAYPPAARPTVISSPCSVI